jgi:Zn finger protein HypA/HybF involved in hydrogenase expression
MSYGHKWCDNYNVWCNEVEEIIEEPDCDMECKLCDDCSLILDGGRSVKINEIEVPE